MSLLVIVAWLVAVILAMGLLALWLYAIVSIHKSMRAVSRARRAIEKRGCSASVSVIIAARNEAHNLEKLLPRLLVAGFSEVIVVDDASSDETPRVLAELSRRHESLIVVRVENIPNGWAPKPYALLVGSSRASSDVLLFLDADTEPLEPEKLRCLAASMKDDEVIGFVPRFLCRTRRCASVEAAVTATAYGFYGLHRVMSRGDDLAWMYGCCWAIRRGTYQRLGGHRLVAPSYVEDRDFAKQAKKKGLRLLLPDARDIIGVWTYDTATEYAWLIARLFVDPLEHRSRVGKIAASIATMLTSYGPLALALLAPLAPSPLQPLLLAPLATQTIAYAAGAMIEGYSPLYALPGLLYGQLVYPVGLIRALRGQVLWKNRRVRPTRSQAV